jgi:hypothetical protein
MKKIFITACISLLLVSCTPPKTIEITQEYFDAQYTQEDRSINLEDKNIKGFISLNEFKSDIEINNIYLSNNKIDIINVSDFDKL